MSSNRIPRSIGPFAGLLAALFLVGAADPPAKTDVKSNSGAPAPGSTEIQLQGKVVCLAEEMHQLHQANLPTGHEHLLGLRTKAGDYYTLLHTKYSEAIFADERVRSRELLVRARLFPKSHLVEVMNLRTVKDGVVHDLYYYCVICEIYAVAPAICECCQGPTEFVEKPLK